MSSVVWQLQKTKLTDEQIYAAEDKFNTNTMEDKFCLATMYMKTKDIVRIKIGLSILTELSNEGYVVRESLFYSAYGNYKLGDYVQSKLLIKRLLTIDEGNKDAKELLKLVEEEQDQLRKDRKKNEAKKKNIFATNEQSKKIKQILKKIEERKSNPRTNVFQKSKEDYISRISKNELSYLFNAFKNIDVFKTSKFDGDSFQRSCDLFVINGCSFAYLYVFPFFEKLTTTLLAKAKMTTDTTFLDDVNYIEEEDDDLFDFQEEETTPNSTDSDFNKGSFHLVKKSSFEGMVTVDSPPNDSPLKTSNLKLINKTKRRSRDYSSTPTLIPNSNPLLSVSMTSSLPEGNSSYMDMNQRLSQTLTGKNRMRTGTVAIKENREIEASRMIDLEQYFFALSILFKGTMEERLIMSFQAFDSDSKGFLLQDDLRKAFESTAELFNELGIEMNDPTVLAETIMNFHGKKKIQLSDFVEIISKNYNQIITFGMHEMKKEEIQHGIKIGVSSSFAGSNFHLVLGLMLGIRNSVTLYSPLRRKVCEDDFSVEVKFTIPCLKNEDDDKTIQQKPTVFLDYAPRVFQAIRKFYSISEEEYLLSIGFDQVVGNLLFGKLSTLSELNSEGKSGSHFFYSHDGKFMIKCIPSREFNAFKRCLPKYYNHLLNNPKTLINRFIGCFEYEGLGYVVTQNLFCTKLEIHEIYDLKGSTISRSNPKGRVKKDNDLKTRIDLLQDQYQELNSILNNDLEFLQLMNFTDYSFLLGIHNFTSNSLSIIEGCDSNTLFQKNLGNGILSSDSSRMFYCGIIDILSEYDLKKATEVQLRTIQYGSKAGAASAQPPDKYAKRMSTFMTTKALKEVQNKKLAVRFRDSFGGKPNIAQSHSLTKLSDKELIDLILNVLDESGGVEIKDRKQRFKTYSQCFVGSELVSLVIKYLNCDRETATNLIQKEFFEKYRVIKHVNDESEFKDDNSFYEKVDSFLDRIECSTLKVGVLHFDKKSKQPLDCLLYSDSSLIVTDGQKSGKIKKLLIQIESVFKNVEQNGFSIVWNDGKSAQVSRFTADSEEDLENWISTIQEMIKAKNIEQI